jgi:hypothetical protein
LFNAVCVFGHAWQRDDHVFIDLEGVGMAADGGCAFAVQPKFLARAKARQYQALRVAELPVDRAKKFGSLP